MSNQLEQLQLEWKYALKKRYISKALMQEMIEGLLLEIAKLKERIDGLERKD